MNNYDQSSSGENITLNVFYDSGLAQFYFNDFKNGSDGNEVLFFGDRENDYCVIGDHDAPAFKISQLRKMKKSELVALDEIFEKLGPYDYNEVTRLELIDELINVSFKEFYTAHYSENSWHNLDCDFVSRGYSQGDAVKIKVLSNCNYKPTQKNIDHLFWDAPVSINIEINGDDIADESELLTDIYEYDLDQLKGAINKLDISDYSKNWIIANLPINPSYN